MREKDGVTEDNMPLCNDEENYIFYIFGS